QEHRRCLNGGGLELTQFQHHALLYLVLGGHVHDGVTQFADAFNHSVHHVTRPHPLLRITASAHAFRGTGSDDVTGFQRDTGADVSDQVVHVEQHVLGVGALLGHTVQSQAQVQVVRIGQLVSSHDNGTERSVGVLAFGVDPLTGTTAVAGAHVDHDGVTEHVLQSVFFGHALSTGAHDHGQFHFPVHLLSDVLVVLDGIARANHGGWWLGENHGLFGQLFGGVQRAAGFGHVFHVVQADTKDVLAWAW